MENKEQYITRAPFSIQQEHEVYVREDGTAFTREDIFVKLNVTFRDSMLARLKGAPLSVLVCLSLHCKNADMQAWPSLDKIAEETGYSYPTVCSAIKALEKKGLVTKTRRKNPDRQDRTNLYALKAFFTMGKHKDSLGLDEGKHKVDTPQTYDLPPPNHKEILPEEDQEDKEDHDQISQNQEQEPPPDNSSLDAHVWDLEESPGTEHECPSCDGTYSLGDLKGSRACCPECKRPVRVVAGDNIVKKAARPQGKVTGGLGEWMSCVKAFCALAPLASFVTMTKRARFSMAGVIKDHAEFATDEPDPSFAAQVISSLDITYQPEGLSSPNQIRFYTPFREAMQKDPEPEYREVVVPSWVT